jgi:hypothetical protein
MTSHEIRAERKANDGAVGTQWVSAFKSPIDSPSVRGVGIGVKMNNNKKDK